MTKEERLYKKYIEAKKKKEKADIEFHKALNRYFTHLHGKALGSAVGYASTLDW